MAVYLNPIQINTQYKHPQSPTLYKNNGINFCSKTPLKINYPDLKQYTIPEVGEYYCAPVSAANAIIMLAHKGFSNLYQNKNSLSTIHELAKHFKTTNQGTTTENLCNGLKSYAESKGYKADIKYQGFRKIDSNIKSSNVPDLNWIKNEINKNNAVLLNLGIYKKSVQDGKTVYKRQYGHFVTLTDTGHNGLANVSDYLTIHDPYNHIQGDHYIKVKPITEGKFIHNTDDNEISLTDNAVGFLEIPQKFNYFASDEVAVINGALSFNVYN